MGQWAPINLKRSYPLKINTIYVLASMLSRSVQISDNARFLQGIAWWLQTTLTLAFRLVWMDLKSMLAAKYNVYMRVQLHFNPTPHLTTFGNCTILTLCNTTNKIMLEHLQSEKFPCVSECMIILRISSYSWAIYLRYCWRFTTTDFLPGL